MGHKIAVKGQAIMPRLTPFTKRGLSLSAIGG